MSWHVRFRSRAVAAVLPSLALAVTLPAQSPQPRQWTIAQMESEYADPFTCVRWGSVRELADGRLMVADPSEKRLEIIDFRTGSGRALGRQGSGPGEWGLPMSLAALGPDTTLLFDPQNGRLLKIASNGAIADATIPLPAGRGGFAMMGARGYDAQGRLYYQGSSVITAPGQPIVATDSAAIVRFDPRSQAVDTVAYIRVPKPDVQQQSGSGGQLRMTVSISPNPFLPGESWAAAPDGRVAILKPEPYRVEWVGADGARSAGPAVPYERLRVTSADRQAVGGGGPQCAFSVTRTSGGGGQTGFTQSVTRGGPQADAPTPRNDWPDFKPPFLASNATPPVTAPSGEVWVPRTTAANDQRPRFDVFDARGRLIAQATLPRGSRLLGFGRGVVYLSRMDEDDLVYIQRWKLEMR